MSSANQRNRFDLTADFNRRSFGSAGARLNNTTSPSPVDYIDPIYVQPSPVKVPDTAGHEAQLQRIQKAVKQKTDIFGVE